jgi:hypothetical protein
MVYLVATEHRPPSEFHIGDELSDDHRDDLLKMLVDDFPGFLQHVDSPHASRPWNRPIYTTGPMRRRKLNRLSLAKPEELKRQLKDVVTAVLIRTSRSQFGSIIMFVRIRLYHRTRKGQSGVFAERKVLCKLPPSVHTEVTKALQEHPLA